MHARHHRLTAPFTTPYRGRKSRMWQRRGGFGEHRRVGRRILYALIVALCAAPMPLAMSVTPASAAETLNEDCLLRVKQPIPQGGGVLEYNGSVECTKAVWTRIEVCAEVENTVNHNWYLISGSCFENKSPPVFKALNELEGFLHSGDCGVYYRTWDYAEAWHGNESTGPTTEWGATPYISSRVKDTC